jgi:hypothetical protein
MRILRRAVRNISINSIYTLLRCPENIRRLTVFDRRFLRAREPTSEVRQSQRREDGAREFKRGEVP